ncbi:hypothetical protein [Streptomyces sp. 142MFCol3.1]|uniref:hypothetical protein n=1 Tax=Streptomyces sp. 142MFCol3.1 TaxID=1172179 RepID=UPI0004263726|nr:hypothetical protein [Streptomyces sp. 142MFCol3.1]
MPSNVVSAALLVVAMKVQSILTVDSVSASSEDPEVRVVDQPGSRLPGPQG